MNPLPQYRVISDGLRFRIQRKGWFWWTLGSYEMYGPGGMYWTAWECQSRSMAEAKIRRMQKMDIKFNKQHKWQVVT